MMLRIREYNKENDSLSLLAVENLKDSDISETIKTLKFFKDNNLNISINREGIGDNSNNQIYSIENIEFEFPSHHISEEERTCISLNVDVIETYY